MFCVGFGSSLTASAATPYTFLQNSQPIVFDISGNGSPTAIYQDSSFNTIRSYTWTESITEYYGFPITRDFTVSNVSRFIWGDENSHIPFTFLPSLYDYYFLFNVFSNSGPFTFVPSSAYLVQYTCTDGSTNRITTFKPMDINVYHMDDKISLGFTVVARCPDYIDNTSINQFCFDSSSPGSFPGYAGVYGVIVALPKGNYGDSDLRAVVSAIQNQTLELKNKIDSSTEYIQQSIEDQYGGDPGSSFPVDDIIMQHNEKMGVLSFSSEALMQVLGLLSPDQTLSSELVFPSMSLTIAGQRNKVQLWPEYRFDLNTLKQHWPDFVELMQSLTSALVWIFVLRYCYRVFEKYFLAGGGS